ncbi:hypothetical protein C2E23DRAFT_93399 [Lenzites betulinus]|nr:hypothetical protein C2E23DRAFT_93399 [Lenzites betulinus]
MLITHLGLLPLDRPSAVPGAPEVRVPCGVSSAWLVGPRCFGYSSAVTLAPHHPPRLIASSARSFPPSISIVPTPPLYHHTAHPSKPHISSLSAPALIDPSVPYTYRTAKSNYCPYPKTLLAFYPVHPVIPQGHSRLLGFARRARSFRPSPHLTSSHLAPQPSSLPERTHA